MTSMAPSASVNWEIRNGNDSGQQFPWPVLETGFDDIVDACGGEVRNSSPLFVAGHVRQFGEDELGELLWCGFEGQGTIAAATFGSRSVACAVPTDEMLVAGFQWPTQRAFAEISPVMLPAVVAFRSSHLRRSFWRDPEYHYKLSRKAQSFDEAVASLMVVRWNTPEEHREVASD